jgi:hypothetical protein
MDDFVVVLPIHEALTRDRCDLVEPAQPAAATGVPVVVRGNGTVEPSTRIPVLNERKKPKPQTETGDLHPDVVFHLGPLMSPGDRSPAAALRVAELLDTDVKNGWRPSTQQEADDWIKSHDLDSVFF